VFRDEKQANSAIRALLEAAGLQAFWTTNGPTEEAGAAALANGGPLWGDKALVLRAAFDLWNRSGGVHMLELTTVSDAKLAETLCSLLAAANTGGMTLENWIHKRRRAK
jgi:hypothetical protein